MGLHIDLARPRSSRTTDARLRAATSLLLALVTGLTGVTVLAAGGAHAAAPVGAGFTVTRGDLAFVLRQVQIAERHAATATAGDPCGSLVGAGTDQLPDRLSPWGLRTVDGSCNNLFAGTTRHGAADEVFPRLTSTDLRDAQTSPSAFGPPHPTSYQQRSGSVFDAHPRLVSTLVSDQTATNPAAVAASGHPPRTQNQAGYRPCTTDPDPVAGTEGQPIGCVPSGQTLPVPNVSTDVGLSPPFNGVFTLFGQFFDHGIDQTVKGGGTVFVPLADDDPLVLGPDRRAGTSDDLPSDRRFMVLSRARNQPGPDGVQGTADDVKDATNTDTPWVDLSQTYSSHPSHQVFLREYALAGGRPVDTGHLLGGLPGTPGDTGLATWASVKRQARDLLGLELADADVSSVPLLAVDPYGNFLAGPHGLPQYVTGSGLVEGDLAQPVAVPADAVHFDTPFVTDIAHAADPTTAGYDAALLGAHVAAGDGRANENIGLTAIHQVFAAEHERLVTDVDATLRADTTAKGLAALAAWQGTGPAGWTYGQRLFQAARLVTEMEYQHIVFEEFARKVQPGIAPFASYHPDVDPAVPAEFAHAVYRFGHSMLTDTIARTAPDGTSYSVPLLDGFLAPEEYLTGRNGAVLPPRAAAGGILLGMADQVGAEIDEFVPETLRNNLMGLPLDLATLNLARGRSEGVPSLNRFRRELHERTGDARLTPYTSWNDLGQHLKHPETLVNLVAAYGTHPTLRDSGPDGTLGTEDDVVTVTARRSAAQALIDPEDGTSPSQDAVDFLEGYGAWQDRATGLDDVDLWIGGLAEATPPFGGLLGSTFDHVFEQTLTDLQNGDRFYYVNRLSGLNLLTQVEGTSMAELVQRSTDGTSSLKADVFAVADCHFEAAHLAGTAEAYAQLGATVADDPASACDESALLLRKPDGTLAYRSSNTVDPPGINAQTVWNGAAGADRITGGNDDDTFWGNEGNDRIEGSTGNDTALGGTGDDVITDAGGLDVLKGGPGADALDGGPGLDVLLGGPGPDVTNGGAGDNETFGDVGDDFAVLGTGNDTLVGGPGSDWAEGGAGVDSLSGDNGGLLPGVRTDDPAGHDVLLGGTGDTTYDGEAGDDVMGAGPSLERFTGGAGWDWAVHQLDTTGADDDLLVNGAGVPLLPNRDRWLETEAVSGSTLDDVLRGDDETPRLLGGGGLAGCDVLDQAGIDRISGLGALLPVPTFDLAPVAAASAMRDCAKEGPVWGEGNILLGGAGSDVLQGRGGDDVLDGDRALRVRISVRTDPSDPGTEVGSTTSLEKPYLPGSSRSLLAAVFDGTVSPRQLVTVREVVTPAPRLAEDTAVFFGARSDYSVRVATDGTVTVQQISPLLKDLGQKVEDGTDTLRNIERLQFSDRTVLTAPPAAPTLGAVAPGVTSARVGWTAAPLDGRVANTGFEIEVSTDGVVQRVVGGIASTTTSYTVTGLAADTDHTFRVRTLNTFGPGAWSAASPVVTPTGAVAVPPAAPTGVQGAPGDRSVRVTWTPGSDGGSPVSGWEVEVRRGSTLVTTVTVAGSGAAATVTGLTNGTAYTVRVRGTNAAGASDWSASSAPVTPAAPPGSPRISKVSAGAKGGPLTAKVSWSAPRSTGGSALTAYVVVTLRAGTGGSLTEAGRTTTGARTTTLETVLPAGTYRFQVVAQNAAGDSPPSPLSATVTPR